MSVRDFLKAWAAMAFAVVALAAFGAPAAAQSGLAGRAITVCLRPAQPGDSAARLLAAPQAFDCTTPQTRFGSGDFWARAQSVPEQLGPQLRYHVRTFSVWQKDLTLYGQYADGVVVKLPIGGARASRNIQLGGILEGVLPGRPAPLVNLLWHVEQAGNMRGVVIGARLATGTESANANIRMAGMYGAFWGLCLALLVYNLAMWGALRHKFQLTYCVMVIALMVYAVSSSGALAWLMPGLLNVMRLKINYAALSISSTSAVLFARSFFEPRIFSGWMGRAATAVCGALLGSGLLFVLFGDYQPVLFDRMLVFAFLGLVAIVPVVLIRAFVLRSNYLWIFALAWAAPVIFAGIRMLSGLGVLPWNFWLDNSTILAMAAEALLSSLAITYRVRLLSRERDEARVNELAARALADLDPLTGLLNRRSFLSHAIGRAGDQLLLIADLDHFKLVNETIGHDGGDEVLRRFARTLRSAVPADALIARIGGEEFAIVTAADRPIDPERILTRLRGERMPFDLTVTASIGASQGPLATEIDWKALYRRADRALYVAKAEGRDRARQDMAIAA